MPKKVLITGGTGLVGSAIRHVVEQEAVTDEKWIFCSSKDADLRYSCRYVGSFCVTNFRI